MAYDEAFFEQYAAYLEEPTVRQAHDWVFTIGAMDPAFRRVIDFGCGQHHEFKRCMFPEVYVGVDAQGRPDDPDLHYECDYRTMDLTGLDRRARAFVSLFSTEITAPWAHNYDFYGRVFCDLPRIRAGLVSGFYYAGRETENPIQETGGIRSYQTLETMRQALSSRFTEKRVILPVPSAMFGPNVYEVWKFFERVS